MTDIVIEVPSVPNLILGLPGPSGPPSTQPGPPGQKGDPGPPGLPGGGTQQSVWLWQAAPVVGEVPTGTVGVDVDEPADATSLSIAKVGQLAGIDWSVTIAAMQAGDHLYAQAKSDASSWHRWTLTGDAVEAGTNWVVPIESDGGSPQGTEPDDGDEVLVAFQFQPLQGPKGDPGENGSDAAITASAIYNLMENGRYTTVTLPEGYVVINNTAVSIDTNWYAFTEYEVNDLLILNGLLYRSKTTHNTNHPPATSPTHWAVVPLTVSGTLPVGGTTGQVLAKKTAADLDTQWVTPAATGAYRGDWNSATAYSPLDLVTYGGGLWAANTGNTNVAPVLAPAPAIAGSDGGPGSYDPGSGFFTQKQLAHAFRLNASAKVGGVQITQSTGAAPVKIEVGILNAMPTGTALPLIAPSTTIPTASMISAGSNRWNLILDTPVDLTAGPEYWMWLRAVDTAVLTGITVHNSTANLVYTGICVAPTNTTDRHRNDGGTWAGDWGNAHTHVGILTVAPQAWTRIAT